MSVSEQVIEAVSQAILKDLTEADLWIQGRLDNFIPLLGQLTDENPAWLAPQYVDDKLREHGLPEHLSDEYGDDAYLRVADRVVELAGEATQANRTSSATVDHTTGSP